MFPTYLQGSLLLGSGGGSAKNLLLRLQMTKENVDAIGHGWQHKDALSGVDYHNDESIARKEKLGDLT